MAEFPVMNELVPCTQILWGPKGSPLAQKMMDNLKQANPDMTSKGVNNEDEIFLESFAQPGRFDTLIWFYKEQEYVNSVNPGFSSVQRNGGEKKYNLWVNDT
jgi:hypothetical protein